jgi:hypothetical protein
MYSRSSSSPDFEASPSSTVAVLIRRSRQPMLSATLTDLPSRSVPAPQQERLELAEADARRALNSIRPCRRVI